MFFVSYCVSDIAKVLIILQKAKQLRLFNASIAQPLGFNYIDMINKT